MPDLKPEATRLEDYTPPPFLIDTVDLDFGLDEDETRVRARLAVRRNPGASTPAADLVLDGGSLTLDALLLDGVPLGEQAYRLDAERLTVLDVPDDFVLETAVTLRPSQNTSLEGLYVSSGTFCTQCEAEGFRKITWFPDRPDVMSRYTTRIEADRASYPVLLSNGDALESGPLADGRHWVRWVDPFPKPSYLFALVGGDLACVEDAYTTASGREVRLRIYVEHHNRERCDHAMQALKKAMRWDEEVYGLQYDLDTYMIVAVDDFNMGAMENKGLNVFNSKYVLADPQTATDADHAAIEGIIAHEYFHNWTGNRVTCRDWFQLSLKEGLTVFRDQEFSADVTTRDLKRIQDVRVLRTHQFAEDAGPMAHPVRPHSYIEISNFYTVTVYNKGAEVVRMIHTLLGPQGFRAGMDLYFERHDGQAVTTEEFIRAMEDASGVDLAQFRRWYTQAGTPVVEASARHDPQTRTLALELRQSCPPTPGQPDKAPFHVPVRIGLLGPDGEPLAVRPAGATAPAPSAVLQLREATQTFALEDVPVSPVVSLGRGFSAPVKLRVKRSDAELGFLMAHDSDPFNRWDAAQELAIRVIVHLVETWPTEVGVPGVLVEGFARVLADQGLDQGLAAETLGLPSETYLAHGMDNIDVDAIHAVRLGVRQGLARALEPEMRAVYRRLDTNDPYRFDAVAAGRRALRNRCLAYLMELDADDVRATSLGQLRSADNMTDELAALAALANAACPEREEALAHFEARWHDDPLVMDKWFSIQATSRLPDTLDRVRGLMSHPAYEPRNPNRVRSLIGAFCHGNPVRFHHPAGDGYRFLAEQVIAIDPANPQLAARLLGPFSRWRRFDPARGSLMRAELERILATPSLSKDVYEIASKTLA
jgi:aminopeptidase N